MSRKATKTDVRRTSTLMPGQPGYRTQAGRSGYDPFETQQEAAYVTGVLLRKLVARIARLFRRRTSG
jgi:hypothetical protein